MNHYLLRRKYRILLLILIAGSIYLCFQLFSFKVLNFSSQHALKFNKLHSGKLWDESAGYDDIDKLVKVDRAKKYVRDNRGEGAKVIGVNVNEGKIDIKIVDVQDRENKEDRDVDLPRGVHVTQTEAYKKRKGGMFQCLQTKELIPYDAVNDDYCDCQDSSDEPGTSACPDSVFYCTFQQLYEEPLSVPGSRVNDGVCDCCDGSDEWSGAPIFQGIHITGKTMRGALSHAPCENKCAEETKANEQDAKIRQQGRMLKQAYITAGKHVAKNDLYGPNGVFYKLSTKCFDYDASEYKYTFCPFKSVTQSKGADSTDIGKNPVWKVKAKGVYVLEMQNGNLQRCPGGRHRITVVTFICGLTDKIIQLAEEEKCVYKLRFSTPAAC